jgi:FkbM family methyltransferase
MASLKHLAISLLPRPLRAWLRHRRALGQIERYQESDWEWSDTVRRLVTPGSTVVDAGANIGYLCRLFARWVGPEGRVVAVEPIVETFNILRDAHEGQDGWRHVFLLNAALSDETGTATMIVPRQAAGVENFYEASLHGAPGDGVEMKVEKRTLDELCRHLDIRPDFIKIDVEGHELEVLRGGSNLLASLHPALLIEVKGEPNDPASSAGQLFQLLAGLGYLPHVLGQTGLRPRRAEDRTVDVLFLQPGHRRTLGLPETAGA